MDALIQSLKTVYSHLTNKKKELKKFLKYINANNSYNFRIKRITTALFIELDLKEFIKKNFFVIILSLLLTLKGLGGFFRGIFHHF